MNRIGGLAAVLACLEVCVFARPSMDAAALNRAMSPGINYGAVFDADPPEGWGLKARQGDFRIMAAAGFKGVRIPVRWSAKAAAREPYGVDPVFFARVDGMVRAALDAGLIVVLNIHNYDALYNDPVGERPRFLSLWKQIADHYHIFPNRLIFEILNEPHAALRPDLWNPLYKEALAVIRVENPDRVVMISGADWGGARSLADLSLPQNDPNIIVSFHDYTPMRFTHQAASWVGPESQAWLGTQWRGDFEENEELRRDFEQAKDFEERHKVPLCLGEYGSYSRADMDSRVRWTRAMSELAQRYGFSRFYWEFKSSGFGVYDESTGRWRMSLKDAVLLKN